MATDQQLSELLSDFARTMVTEFPIQAILDHLVQRIVAILPITAAGVTLISTSSGPPHYIAASSAAALRFEELQSELAEGPCLAAYRSDRAITVPDLSDPGPFARFAPLAWASGLAAVFAFPLRHGDAEPIGALDLYRDTPGPLSQHDLYASQTLADVAAAYILNAQAREDLREASDRFQQIALHDPLTGLPNRVLFGQLLDQAVQRSSRTGAKVAVLFADLDHFKDVNDLFGHQTGDHLLQAVAARLTSLLGPDDTLARLAGDEFVILSESLDDPAGVEQLADRINNEMDTSFRLSGIDVHVTASVGIAYSGAGVDVPDRILRDADMAMYQAKRRGGGRNQVLDLREQENVESRMSLRRDLYGVLERGELETHYQPIVQTGDGALTGFEALVRWSHPTRGVVPPSLLVPLAEQTNVIGEIGTWVLQQACANRARWDEAHAHPAPLQISVNVSPHELLSVDYIPTFESAISGLVSDPGLITVEVTEDVFITDPERARVVLNDLKKLGVRLALDDFGTGYSSLSYLQDFPVDVVKIDRSFVERLGDGGVSHTIVAAIIDLAHALGMTVVAEGMETAEQHEAVAALGCDHSQGYYFSRPLREELVDELLVDHLRSDGVRLPVLVPAQPV